MRILFLSTWYPYPPDNGSKLRVAYLLRELSRRHEVSLIAFDFDTPDLGYDKWSTAELAYVERVPSNPFSEARKAGWAHRFSLHQMAVGLSPVMRRAVQKRLLEGAIETVIASTFICLPYALESPDPVVRVLEEHNSLTGWSWEHYVKEAHPLRRVCRWLSWQKTRYREAQLFRQFDLVTAVSEQDAHAMTTMLPGYRGPVAVVANGVDCDHNRLGLTSRLPNMLVYNGALTYNVNYDAMQYFLTSIFPLIRQRIPDVTLTITGSTQNVSLAGLALNPAVRLPGYVPDVRIPVAQAAACVVPLRDGSGTRLKILEAMALGTPVVTTSKGVEGLEAVAGTHFLLADTPADFAGATVELLSNPELRAALSIKARQLVEKKYDWRQIGIQFTQFVEQAATDKRQAVQRKLNTR